MTKKLSLQKETLHRLGGSPLPPNPDRDALRGGDRAGMNVESSIRITTTIFTQH
jgi:hypothetical protein